MAFCPNCGAQAQGAFCPNCGSAIGGAAPSSSVPNPGAYAPPPTVVSSGGLEPHIASMLCYLPVFPFGVLASIIFLVAAPYNQNKFVRFSAFQSLFLHGACIVLYFVLAIAFTILLAILHGLGFMFGGLFPLFSVAILVGFLFMMYKAFNNEKVKLPIIGDLAEKQA
jgi:uncharacterized membrane protein